jgi:hypothetical protein
MEYQDDQPSEHPTDCADEYGEQVDGYVIRQNEVRQQEEDHPYDPVDYKVPQETRATRQHEQDDCYNQYEYDEFHRPPLYIKHRSLEWRTYREDPFQTAGRIRDSLSC